ncbi:MAG: hypothetical protein AABW46_02140 [Nanoarchaeota archaeon]
MKKAQIGLEAIFIIGIVLIIFFFILGYGFDKRNDIRNSERFILQQDECFKISNLIIGAFINGNGTEIRINLEYTANTLPNSRLININDKTDVTCTIPINAFSQTNLNSGNIRVYNQGDFVLIENV